MRVAYQDYYDILGVQRSASADDIQKSYRALARKYHPDICKESNAEDKFKRINEAYEVLGDADKRKRYDALGANWQNGQDFQPPPGFEQFFAGQQGGAGGFPGGGFGASGTGYSFGSGHSAQSGGSFSDFFEALFGDSHTLFNQFERGQGSGASRGRARNGQSLEADFPVTVEDLFHGGKRQISFDFIQSLPDGTRDKQRKNYSVKIPAGTSTGSVIRLAGQGAPGIGGGKAGDLLLRVRVAKHPHFRVNGYDVEADLDLAPWEAALGAKLELPTLDSKIVLKVPEATQSGKIFRLKGKGLAKKSGSRGDLLFRARIVVPEQLSDQEKKILEDWSKSSTFAPREVQL